MQPQAATSGNATQCFVASLLTLCLVQSKTKILKLVACSVVSRIYKPIEFILFSLKDFQHSAICRYLAIAK